MTWNFDPFLAPKGETITGTRMIKRKLVEFNNYKHEKIIAATDCGKVMTTRWLPEPERWEGFCKGQSPLAWMPWPTHPNDGEQP